MPPDAKPAAPPAYSGHVVVDHQLTGESVVSALYQCRTREEGEQLGAMLRALTEKEDQW